jgi:hypothetical protein
MAEYLPRMCEALGSIPSPQKKKKGKENKNEKASKLLPFLSAGWEEQKA